MNSFWGIKDGSLRMKVLKWVFWDKQKLTRRQGREVGKQGGQVRLRNKMQKGAEAQNPWSVKESGQERSLFLLSAVLRHGQRLAAKGLV